MSVELANEVFLVRGVLEDKWGRALERCENPACGRFVKVGTMYCCGGCGEAHRVGAEPHGGGDMFSHSSTCNERHEERQTALKRNR